jgi:hypothetical protein
MKLTLSMHIEVKSLDEMQQLAAHLGAFQAAESKEPKATPKASLKPKPKPKPAPDPLDRALIETDLREIMARIGPERMRAAKEEAGISVRLQNAEGDDLAAYRALADRLAQGGSDA